MRCFSVNHDAAGISRDGTLLCFLVDFWTLVSGNSIHYDKVDFRICWTTNLLRKGKRPAQHSKGATKVMHSYSLGLVKQPAGLACFNYELFDGQAKFAEIKLMKWKRLQLWASYLHPQSEGHSNFKFSSQPDRGLFAFTGFETLFPKNIKVAPFFTSLFLTTYSKDGIAERRTSLQSPLLPYGCGFKSQRRRHKWSSLLYKLILVLKISN